MKKFDLYTELQALGFKAVKDQFGRDCLTNGWMKNIEVAFYGPWVSRLNIDVVFNTDHSVATVSYYDGGRRPFKTKTHLNEKRALNAIKATAENKGFEI